MATHQLLGQVEVLLTLEMLRLRDLMLIFYLLTPWAFPDHHLSIQYLDPLIFHVQVMCPPAILRHLPVNSHT